MFSVHGKNKKKLLKAHLNEIYAKLNWLENKINKVLETITIATTKRQLQRITIAIQNKVNIVINKVKEVHNCKLQKLRKPHAITANENPWCINISDRILTTREEEVRTQLRFEVHTPGETEQHCQEIRRQFGSRD